MRGEGPQKFNKEEVRGGGQMLDISSIHSLLDRSSFDCSL